MPAEADTCAEATAALHRGDYETAARLARVLAEQGNAAAQYNLGLMYHRGEGVPQDDAEAVKWCREAAEQSEGATQDDVLACMWFGLAADQGNEDARRSRKIAVERMTREQKAKAQRLARKWRAEHQ